jgi:predicted GH43/DUF377 family glycosyl hydrolase
MTGSPLAACATPHKLGRLVLAPSHREGDFDSHGVDCPFPFFHEGHYLMTYVGWDGLGYRTGWASSVDLVRWVKQGILLDRGPRGSVTEHNVALTSILRDNALFGPGNLKRVNGRLLGTYHAYPAPGYEQGPAVIGLCFSHGFRKWEIGEPILRPDPACAWEAGGLYKSWLIEHDGTYYLFYNAKNDRAEGWIEQTGVATSRDLVHWERSPLNPILPNGRPGEFDDVFASDPAVFRHGDEWVMFYFGFCSDGHARESVAFSSDLLHWRKSGQILINAGPPGSVDSRHAHKPGLFARDGVLHHYYCAVAPMPPRRLGAVTLEENRGISLARGEAPPGAGEPTP